MESASADQVGERGGPDVPPGADGNVGARAREPAVVDPNRPDMSDAEGHGGAGSAAAHAPNPHLLSGDSGDAREGGAAQALPAVGSSADLLVGAVGVRAGAAGAVEGGVKGDGSADAVRDTSAAAIDEAAWPRLLVGHSEAEVAIVELVSMGFDDRERNQAALMRSFGDIGGAVEALLAEQAGAPLDQDGAETAGAADDALSAPQAARAAWSRLTEAHPEAEVALAELASMGFDDDKHAKAALVRSGGEIGGAVEVLLSGSSAGVVMGADAEQPEAGIAPDGTSEAVERLLPCGQMPECALLWVQNRQSNDVTEEDIQRRAAAEWALKALCHAHEDPRLKKAVRRLLAIRYFTSNLDAAGNRGFSNMLRRGLRARLVELGAPLKVVFDDADLAWRLSDDAVAEAVGRPEGHSLAIERERSGIKGRPTQIDLLPSVDTFVDFAKPEAFPDEVYAHTVLMVAAALDASFQAAVATAVREHNAAWARDTGKPGTAKHSAAPTKAAARVGTKVQSDYRYEAAPRAQHNVDVVRCLVTADTPEELLALSGRLVKATFGGVVRVKNLFSAPEAERAERFHLLPLMLTVALDAGGETYREFVRRPEATAAFDAYVAARDVTVPPHRWTETTALARAMLESGELSGVLVRLLGELQMVLEGHAKVRHAMHEVYKAYRAESDDLLWEDYARTAMGEGEGGGLDDELSVEPKTLWAAAYRGNRPAVEVFLQLEGGNVNVVDDGTSITALGMAAQRGYTDVVKVLSEDGRVDVNLGKPDMNVTPLYAAAQSGHTDVVRVLLAYHAAADVATTTDGSSPVHAAVQSGHIDVVRTLLRHGAGVNVATSDNGRTPLLLAAQGGRIDVVRVLLEYRADANQGTTDDGNTPLFMAAQQGHNDVVCVLLEHRADVNQATTDDGRTPLLMAAQSGHTDIVCILLEHRADVHQATTDAAHTPLFAAARNDHTGVMRLLLEHHADISRATSDDGCTPLFMAAGFGHTNAVHMLLEHHADMNQATTKNGRTPLFMAAGRRHIDVVCVLLENGADVNQATTDIGGTPLYWATSNGHIDVMRLLLQHGADANQSTTDNGRTPLFAAAKNGHTGVVRVLLDHRADVNLATADDGRTPLFVAARSGHTDMASLLLEHRADVNVATTDSGITPLFMAVQQGHTDMIRLLIEHRANVNKARADDGSTPLFYAAARGHCNVARLLIEHSASVCQATTNDGVPPLHMAAREGHTDVVCLLLEQRADANQATTDNGSSPLWTAASNGHIGVVRLLLDHRAAVNVVRTDTGSTPLYMAARNGHPDVACLLIDAGADAALATTDHNTAPLFMAAQNGHTRTVRALLHADADANSRMSDGQSCLFVAAQHGHLDVVKMLVDAGADVNPPPVDDPSAIDPDSSGHTPLSTATANGHKEVAAFLLSSGAKLVGGQLSVENSPWSRLLVGHPEAEVTLVELAAMGFDDRERNQTALVRSFGELDGAVEALLAEQAGAPLDRVSDEAAGAGGAAGAADDALSASQAARAAWSRLTKAHPEAEVALVELASMGFDDDKRAKAAIVRSGGKIDGAVEVLLSGLCG